MAISDAQKVDLLFKKYFGVAKTDTSTNKGAGNEAIPSSVFVRNDKLWYQSQNIPAVAANVIGIVRPWVGTERIALAADTTTTPVSNVYPTWKANLINWIPPEFGATYAVKLYAENGGNVDPSGNTTLSDSGIGSVGEWNFDYQSGVLNFIGGTIPAVLTGSLNQTKVLYLTGYQYTGLVGVPPTTDLVANIANVVLSIANISLSIQQITNRFVANTILANAIVSDSITANTLNVAGNVSFGTGQGGILSGLAYAYATNVITNVLIANTIAPTRVTGNLVVDGKVFANSLVLQNIDVTDVILYGNISAGGGSVFNTLQANTISTGILSVTSNIITLLSGVVGASTSNASISVNRGSNADVALRWEEEVDRWQFTNDGYLYYNLPIPSEYDNVIYSLSAETSNVNYTANLKLTGTKSSGNVLIQDQIAFKGTGLVRVSRQDADTIVVDAGVAPVVVTPVSAATPVEITRFRTNLYRTAEYIYTLNVSGYTDNNHANLYNAGKILILHDNSEVIFSQYAMLLSGTGQELATFTTNINNSNVILYAQATSALANVQITVRLSGTTYTEV
jgi:hypothetical protein